MKLRIITLALTALAIGVPPTPTGAAIVCASAPGPGANDRCPEWEAVRDLGAANNRCFSSDIAHLTAASRNLIFVAGASCRDDGQAHEWPPYGVTVAAFDAATGAERWSAALPLSEPGYPNDEPTGLAVSPAGDRVFVTSTHWTGPSTTADPHAVTAAFDATTGSELWRADYQGPSLYTRTAGLAVSDDGARVFVTGSDISEHTQEAFGSQGVLVLAYDATNGELGWAIRHRDAFASSRPDRLPNAGFAIGTLGERIFVATTRWTTCGPSAQACSTVGVLGLRDDRALDRGEVLWDSPYGFGQRVCPGAGIAVTPSAIAVTGQVPTGQAPNMNACASSTGSTIATAAFDPDDGAPLWAKTYAGECNGSRINRPAAITAAPDGSSVYVAGQSPAPAPLCNAGYVTLAYRASDGGARWTARHDAPGSYEPVSGQYSAKGIFRTPVALAASPDGTRVYVTGLERVHADNFQSGQTFRDNGARTVAHDATDGHLIWSSVEAAGATDRLASGSLIYVMPAGITVTTDGTRVAVATRRQYAGGLVTLNMSDFDVLAYEG